MARSDYKKKDREIRAFIDVSYDVRNLGDNDDVYCYYYNIGGSTNQLTPRQYTKTFSEIINNRKNYLDYSILYNDYTKLNGTYYLFNKNQNLNRCGFISEETPNSIQTYDERNVVFEINIEEGMSGVTFYFKDNTIKNANVELYKKGQIGSPVIRQIINNSEETLFINTSDDDYDRIIIETLEWTMPDRPIWILRLDLGFTHIYKNEEIIEMTIVDQVSKLGEETPDNELRFTIGDYEKNYDPLNPNTLASYFKKDISSFIPYIGIVTDTGEIEYTQMGVFYFDSIEYSDKEVTIVAYNLMKKLSNTMISNKQGTLYPTGGTIPVNGLISYLATYLEYNYNSSSIVNIHNDMAIDNKYCEYQSLSSYFQNLCMPFGIFRISRENFLIMEDIDNTIIETLSKEQLLEDAKYTNVPNYKSFKYRRNNLTIINGEDDNQIFYQTFKVTKDEPEIVCIYSKDSDFRIDLSNLENIGSATITLIGTQQDYENKFYNMVFFELSGDIGDEGSIIGTSKFSRRTEESSDILIGNDENTDIIMDNNLFNYLSSSQISGAFNKYIDKMYSYKVSFDYNGNADLQAGNYIQVETDYGMVPVFIEKHTLKYNGGLSGSIEGVE